MSADGARTTLARRFGLRGAAVPALLAIAAACNVTALLVPFLEVEVFLKGKHVYSLPHSVKLMWEADLHLIAALILLFSILFPLAKLAALTHIWFFARRPGPRRALRGIVEPLGKWSFMDIFVVTIILVLTNDQFFVGARAQAGVYFFIAAIAMAMITTLLIERFDSAPPPADMSPRPPGWSRWVTPAALALSVPALGAAVGLPFIKIDQFLLKGLAYSIAESVPALWEQSNYVIAAVVAATLVAMPAACVAGLFAAWFGARAPGSRLRWRRRLAAMWQWAMIDVFGLALLIFLAEGDALIKTEVKPGLYLIAGAIAVLTATYVLVRHRLVAGEQADPEQGQGDPGPV